MFWWWISTSRWKNVVASFREVINKGGPLWCGSTGFNRRRFRLAAAVSRDEGAYARLRRVNGHLNGRGAFGDAA